jgi:hypothetical protein
VRISIRHRAYRFRPAALSDVSPERRTMTVSFAGIPTLLSSPFVELGPSNMHWSIRPCPGGGGSKRASCSLIETESQNRSAGRDSFIAERTEPTEPYDDSAALTGRAVEA